MTELKAKKGYVWTNGDLYSNSVYLSDLDSVENWKEITIEEALNRQENAEAEMDTEF